MGLSSVRRVASWLLFAASFLFVERLPDLFFAGIALSAAMRPDLVEKHAFDHFLEENPRLCKATLVYMLVASGFVYWNIFLGPRPSFASLAPIPIYVLVIWPLLAGLVAHELQTVRAQGGLRNSNASRQSQSK